MKRTLIWKTFFSQSGSEIYEISKSIGRFPDAIITNKNFEEMDKIVNYLKENNELNKHEIKESLYSSLFKKCYEPEDIKEYVISRKLKRYIKNFNLSMKPNAIPFY